MNLKHKDTLAGLLYLCLPGLFFIILFMILLFIPGFHSGVMYDSDTNWLLKTGEIIVTSGFQIPQHDIYSYTMYGKEWVLYQWLFEVILYYFYAYANLEGVGLLATGAFVVTFTIIFVIQLKENVNLFYVIVSTALGAYCAQITWYARPAVITYMLIALLTFIFYMAEKNKSKYLWILPLIFLLWANMHLGFMSGLMLLLLFLLYSIIKFTLEPSKENGSLIKLLLIVSILSFLASLITPYGFKLFTYMHQLANSYYMNDNIKELLSPNFHKKFYIIVLYALFIVISLGKYSKKISTFSFITLAFATVSTLVFIRNVPFFGIFITLVVGQQLQCLHNEILKSKSVYNILSYPVTFLDHYNKFINYCQNLNLGTYKFTKYKPSLVLILFFLFSLMQFSQTSMMKKYFHFNYHYNRPIEVFQLISKIKPPGRLYTESTWGSAAILHIYPEYKVFIDTRFDMYGEDFFKFSHKLKLGNFNWESTVNKYNINWILVAPNSQFSSYIVKSQYEKWFKVYEDKYSILYMIRNKDNLKWYNTIKDQIPLKNRTKEKDKDK